MRLAVFGSIASLLVVSALWQVAPTPQNPLIYPPVEAPPPVTPPPVTPPPSSTPTRLLHDTDFTYVGAALLPLEFDYGGMSLGWNPDHNSLFVSDRNQWVAEVALPTFTTAGTVAGTNRATYLQTLHDISEGGIKNGTGGNCNPLGDNAHLVGSMFNWGAALIFNCFSDYDGEGKQVLSHYKKASRDLSTTGNLTGPVAVGDSSNITFWRAGFFGRYQALIPTIWRAAFGGKVLTGECCQSIITSTSFGMALFAYDPDQIGVTAPVPAVTLLYHTDAHQMNDRPGYNIFPYSGCTLLSGQTLAQSMAWCNTGGHQSVDFTVSKQTSSLWWNGATKVEGVVLPENSRSVLFFGRQGVKRGDATDLGLESNYCYGDGGPTPPVTCIDYADGDHGTHAFPYRYQVWAYDINDLLAVKAGTKQPWEPDPYAVWELVIPGFDRGMYGAMRLGGVTYDPVTSMLYVVQQFRESGGRPVLHKFHIAII